MFFWETRLFLQYPLNIYPKGLQFIFTTILPFGFVNFYPLQALLGKREGFFAGGIQWLSPLVALILLGITALCWQLITRKYESAGT
jgi:ABC-2 type transport system permease protein